MAYRKSHINQIQKEIAELVRLKLSHENTIENFKNKGSGDKDYNVSRIEKSEQSIIYIDNSIVQLNDKLVKIENGDFDIEFEKLSQNNRAKLKDDFDKQKELRTIEKANEKALEKQLHSFEKKDRTTYNEKSMDREYDKYLNVLDTAPPYIINGLDKLPQNHARKWRGVCFYGKQPERYPSTIFEGSKQGMKTTKYFDDGIQVFYRNHGESDKLVSKRPKNNFDLF